MIKEAISFTLKFVVALIVWQIILQKEIKLFENIIFVLATFSIYLIHKKITEKNKKKSD